VHLQITTACSPPCLCVVTATPTNRASASPPQLRPVAPLHRHRSNTPRLSVIVTPICRASALTWLRSTMSTLSHSTPVEALSHRFLHAAPPRQHRSDTCRCSSDPTRLHDTADRYVWSLTIKWLSVDKKV
jgi:hypothetical protein